MQKMKMLTGTTAALMVTLLLVVSVPAFAHEGADDNMSSPTSGPTTATSNETENGSGPGSIGPTSGSGRQERRDAKKKELSEKREAKKTEVKQKVCENRKKGLTNRASRIVTNSKRIDEKITDIYKKVDNYKTTNNVDVANYEDLTKAVIDAQTNAANAITDLEKVVPTTDCTDTKNTNSADVAAFKTSAKKTRQALKDYRMAVKDLLVAVMKAKSDDATSTGGTE